MGFPPSDTQEARTSLWEGNTWLDPRLKQKARPVIMVSLGRRGLHPGLL